MGLSEEMIAMYQKTAEALKGSERRQFMAGVVKSLGWGDKVTPQRCLSGDGIRYGKGYKS